MFPNPTPAQKLAMTSTHPRAGEWNWLMSVVDTLEDWAEEEPLGRDVFFSYAGDHELEAAEEAADKSFPEDDEGEDEEDDGGPTTNESVEAWIVARIRKAWPTKSAESRHRYADQYPEMLGKAGLSIDDPSTPGASEG